jgi:hypothetical protein
MWDQAEFTIPELVDMAVACDVAEFPDAERIVGVPVQVFEDVVHCLVPEHPVFWKGKWKEDPWLISIHNIDYGQ